MTDKKPRKRDVTRNKVIQAAIDCIYAEGFHAAHTNRIIQQADVSWGVLQYHFGDKDNLLQAVLDKIFADFEAGLNAAELQQKGLRERIDAIINAAWSFVSKPEYRVSVAILRNAGLSPESAVDGRKQMETMSKAITDTWDTVFSDVDVEKERCDAARRLMFASLRGLADEINPSRKQRTSQLKTELSALGDAIHHLLST